MRALGSLLPRGQVLRATATPLASILGSGLLIIAPVLERTLGAAAVLGAVGISALAWLVGSAIRHNVATVEPLTGRRQLDAGTARLERISDRVIVVAYVISVALYLRIMAQYVLGYITPQGHSVLERAIAIGALVVIAAVGITRGFDGLDWLDRLSLVTVLVLTTVLGGALVLHDSTTFAADGALPLPPIPASHIMTTLLVLGGVVITVQGFETIRYLGDVFDAPTRIQASRVAQLVAASIYVGFVAAATPAMGLGTPAGADRTLLDITGRIAPILTLPLALSAVLSQFSAAIADTEAAVGNLRGLSAWMKGGRPYVLGGVAAAALVATTPTYTIVAVASRAFAAYYALQSVVALRTCHGAPRKLGYGALTVVMVLIALFALPAG
ncbi:MAG: hypothetical protein WBV37_14745 [Nocardioidaceae bacterium]